MKINRSDIFQLIEFGRICSNTVNTREIYGAL